MQTSKCKLLSQDLIAVLDLLYGYMYQQTNAKERVPFSLWQGEKSSQIMSQDFVNDSVLYVTVLKSCIDKVEMGASDICIEPRARKYLNPAHTTHTHMHIYTYTRNTHTHMHT